jgi:outer membrane cobalamin receptor
MDRVARIEIVRSSRGSVLYGDNATDGLIDIIAREGGVWLAFGAGLAGGNYNTLNSILAAP